jgi:hypothetical protein
LILIIIGGNPFGELVSLTQVAEGLVKRLLINGERRVIIIYGSYVYLETVFT